jgi:hypothetical protein
VGALMQALAQRYGVTFPPPQTDAAAAAWPTAPLAAAPAAASAAAAFGKKASPADRAAGAAAASGATKTGLLVRSGCAGLYCEGVALDDCSLVLRSVLPPNNLPPQPCASLLLQNGFYEDLHRQKEVHARGSFFENARLFFSI